MGKPCLIGRTCCHYAIPELDAERAVWLAVYTKYLILHVCGVPNCVCNALYRFVVVPQAGWYHVLKATGVTELTTRHLDKRKSHHEKQRRRMIYQTDLFVYSRVRHKVGKVS